MIDRFGVLFPASINMSRKSSTALPEGQVFAQHKAIRRRSSVVFNPPFKRDDDDDDVDDAAEETDENVFEDSSSNATANPSSSTKSPGASLPSPTGNALTSTSVNHDALNVSNPFLERLKKDPRYSPSAIKNKRLSSSSSEPSAPNSLDKKKKISSSSSSSHGPPSSPKLNGGGTPLRIGRASSSFTSPKRGVNVCLTPRSTSATPKLKSLTTTPKLGASSTMSPMAVKAMNNQLRHESASKEYSFSTTSSDGGGKQRTKLKALHHLSPSGVTASSSPGRVLLPNKNLLNTNGASKTASSSSPKSRSISSSSAAAAIEKRHPLTPSTSSTPSSTKSSANSRRSDSMELTSCSPNLVRTSVSTSDESLVNSSKVGRTPSNGDSDMELVETTPSSLPK